MEKTVLIVTAMEGAENLARAISREADAIVEIASSRRAGHGLAVGFRLV